MIQDALDNMRGVKKIGDEFAEAKKRQHILKILTIVLLVLPFVAPEIGTAFGGPAMAARIALIIVKVGNVAVGVEDIIHGKLET
jgi:chitinase